jgi:hypothetical protein
VYVNIWSTVFASSVWCIATDRSGMQWNESLVWCIATYRHEFKVS